MMENLVQSCRCLLTATESRNEKCPRCDTPFVEAGTPISVGERINQLGRMIAKQKVQL